MDTTWAVISWNVPSYIPSDYPIITYEIGYHILQSVNCYGAIDMLNTNALLTVDVDNTYTFINITGLTDNYCYIFGVRAYTDNGYGLWTIIANETLELPTQQPPSSTLESTSPSIFIYPSSTTSNTSCNDRNIAFSVSVGVLFILLTVSVIFNVCSFIRMRGPKGTKQAKADDDIAMQVCEPCDLQKIKLSEENRV
uniref:Fibronectin type-III domain-containing protein n=1 Tax=Amphimedon queenslandica TaxID=400682 RepID=A0A1X7SSD3_AMPQE